MSVLLKKGFKTMMLIKQCYGKFVYLAVLMVLVQFNAAAATKASVKDDPAKSWCYLGKSTTVIGVPFVPEPVQVTYDGAIYTRNAELCFFYGKENAPAMARQKTFMDGWIPIVQYDWIDNGIRYEIEMFSAIVPPLQSDNLVQFVKITMKNVGSETASGILTAAIRSSGEINRNGGTRWNMKPGTKLSFDTNSFMRDGKLVYTFSEGAVRLATPTSPYEQPYTGSTYSLGNRNETGLVRYSKELKPGQTYSISFKMPRSFILDPDVVASVKKAEYDIFRAKTIAYWKETIEGRMSISIPEPRVNESYKASLVHLLLATRGNKGQGNRQGSGLPYDQLFLNDYIDMLLAYDLSGMPQFAEPNVEWLLKKQHKSGMFIDVHNRGNDDIVTSHGQGLFCLAYHYIMTRDDDYARKVYPAVKKAVELIIHDHKTNQYGLMRPSIPYDAPMLTGHHTCHNLFALTALQASIRMAALIGEEKDASEWREAQKSYKKAIIRAIDDIVEKEGYVASGLYDWEAGWVQGRVGSVNSHPNQDWENNLLVYPSELLAPDDERVAKTLATIRKRKYAEGVMTYRNGMHIHQYVTLNQANQYLAIGDQPHALSDYYHVLLHNGSTHEGFENLVEPWTRLVSPSCPPPHAWAAAKTALFTRNMIIREHGGQGGLNPDERDIYLFSLISPAWVAPGKKLEIRNAATEMGTVSATMTFNKKGAVVTVKSDFHTRPGRMALTVPYFVDLVSCKIDDRKHNEVKGSVIYFSPDAKKITLKWIEKKDVHNGTYQNLLKMYRSEYGHIQDRKRFRTEQPPVPVLTDEEQNHPAEVMSFDLVRKAFEYEYGLRLKETSKKAGKVLEIKAPSMKMPPPPSKVRVSAYVGDYSPEKAFDGNRTDLSSSWQTDPYPAWISLDMEKDKTINHIKVYPYWGGGRYYRYTVEISEDGETWTQVGDMSKNTTPSTPDGDEFRFDPVSARYVRVNMLYHNLNKGVHVVEIEVFPTEK